ncbi:MAG: acetyl-CoA carboxylase biotin carboxylase subunit [Burkholderiales bacterium]
MFSKILIANRGEIACRIARTAQHLGIRTVAVYSEADLNARHVAECDEAVLIGPAPARESYLNIGRIVAAAKKTGAQAIHPGYGFLSENAEFAQACAAAGLIFIGPPAAAIRAMGSKSAAKEIMAQAGVPLVPGYHGADQELKTLTRAAEKIGYPVLIKASSGGGGKGMRIVDSAAQLADAIASAKREAASAFGDDQLLIEKYLVKPRHIEVQIFADTQDNAVHLFERDCSVQRRHQKVLEEAPAPGMSASRRKQMTEAAIACARAIGYVGAGTVEFIVDANDAFYFMEMNTRLQVEHPVTEMITGLDLVDWQLRVANGEPLPLKQNQITLNGHAIEARIYAEDPARDFLPATGSIVHLRTPRENAQLRIDSGVRQGDAIGIHYDPLLAKLIVWDQTRAAALQRMHTALKNVQIAGLTTNLQFLARIVNHPAFAQAQLDTGLIERHRAELIPAPAPASNPILALAALSELLRVEHAAHRTAAASSEPCSPWNETAGWRLNLDNHHTLYFRDGDILRTVIAHYRNHHYLLELPDVTINASAELNENGELAATLDGLRVHATVVRQPHLISVLYAGGIHNLIAHDPLAQAMEQEAGDGNLTAPMSGRIIEVMVKAGDDVERGAALMILEAMKMEHTISAPVKGKVQQVNYVKGAQVNEGAELIVFETAGAGE